jgi:hypothetical protein
MGLIRLVPGAGTHLTPKQIEEAGHIKLGPMGTRMWPRGSIAWGINSGMIIIAVGATIAVLVSDASAWAWLGRGRHQ